VIPCQDHVGIMATDFGPPFNKMTKNINDSVGKNAVPTNPKLGVKLMDALPVRESVATQDFISADPILPMSSSFSDVDVPNVEPKRQSSKLFTEVSRVVDDEDFGDEFSLDASSDTFTVFGGDIDLSFDAAIAAIDDKAAVEAEKERAERKRALLAKGKMMKSTIVAQRAEQEKALAEKNREKKDSALRAEKVLLSKTSVALAELRARKMSLERSAKKTEQVVSNAALLLEHGEKFFNTANDKEIKRVIDNATMFKHSMSFRENKVVTPTLGEFFVPSDSDSPKARYSLSTPLGAVFDEEDLEKFLLNVKDPNVVRNLRDLFARFRSAKTHEARRQASEWFLATARSCARPKQDYAKDRVSYKDLDAIPELKMSFMAANLVPQRAPPIPPRPAVRKVERKLVPRVVELPPIDIVEPAPLGKEWVRVVSRLEGNNASRMAMPEEVPPPPRPATVNVPVETPVGSHAGGGGKGLGK